MKIRTLKILGAAALLFSLSVNAYSADVTTLDGKTYRNAVLVNTEPDGIVIRYQLDRPGIAMAKVNFRNLPDSMRNQYGYDASKASAFEAERYLTAAKWREQMARPDSVTLYRNFIELHRSEVGDEASSSYTISIDPDGKVSIQDQIQPYAYVNAYNSFYPWTSGLSTLYGFRPVGAWPYNGTPMPYGAPYGGPYGPGPYGAPGMLRPTGY